MGFLMAICKINIEGFDFLNSVFNKGFAFSSNSVLSFFRPLVSLDGFWLDDGFPQMISRFLMSLI